MCGSVICGGTFLALVVGGVQLDVGLCGWYDEGLCVVCAGGLKSMRCLCSACRSCRRLLASLYSPAATCHSLLLIFDSWCLRCGDRASSDESASSSSPSCAVLNHSVEVDGAKYRLRLGSGSYRS